MLPASSSRVLLLVATAAAIFAATASWGPHYFVDAYTNAMQARSFAADGSPVLEEAEDMVDEKYHGELAWVVSSPRGPAAQYPPGVGLWAAPFYLFDTSLTDLDVTFDNDGVEEPVSIRSPSLVPATAAAVVSVALALWFLARTLSGLLPEQFALAAVAVVAFGTGVWSVAANMLWQHGPAMMGIAAGLYLASRDRFALSGAAFAFALITRPHTAAIAAGVGLWCAWKRRSLRPAVAVALPTGAALLALVGYNWWLWGEPSVTGGYGDVFTSRTADGDLLQLAWRLLLAAFDPRVGFAVTSPFLLLGLVAMVRMRERAPDWSVGAALGGLAYLLVQYKANRVSGGEGFFGYRYPLEAIMAAAPMMAICVHDWVVGDRKRQRLLLALVVASVMLHGIGATTT
jgi:alpha-1,2-mannosyltransferase